MGACILCGKSAGPFYSLHKNCFSKYDSSKQHLATLLCNGLGSETTSVLADKVNQYIASFEFTVEAQKRTLNRALEYFATEYIDINQLTASDIKAWLEMLDELSLDNSLFVNRHFLAQQYNLPALMQLRHHNLPDSNRHPANYSIDMREQETLWWCFDACEIQQDTPVKEKRDWSVIMHLIESISNKQKNTLQSHSMAEGRLLVTNLRIYFESDNYRDELEHKQIYSCTPTKNGVRLQSKLMQSSAQTYLCEDARLLYEFIQYARQR